MNRDSIISIGCVALFIAVGKQVFGHVGIIDAAILGALGGVVGVGISFVVGKVVSKFKKESPVSEHDEEIAATNEDDKK